MRELNVLGPFVDMLLAVLAAILFSYNVSQSKPGVPQQAEYLVTAEWDTKLDADVDLWAVGPPEPRTPVYFSSKEHGAVHLDRDSLGYSTDRIPNADGSVTWLPHREVLTVRGVIPGRYDFALHLYNDNEAGGLTSHDLHVRVHVTVTKINPTVTTLLEEDRFLEHRGDAQNFWSMSVRPDGSFEREDLPLLPIPVKYYDGHAQGAASPVADQSPGHPTGLPGDVQ